jgi:Ca2+-binding EF-hand superfamily protein
MAFSDFLETIHSHNQVEKIPDEILAAFVAADVGNKGVIPAKELRHILGKWGEKLSAREGQSSLQSFNVVSNFIKK